MQVTTYQLYDSFTQYGQVLSVSRQLPTDKHYKFIINIATEKPFRQVFPNLKITVEGIDHEFCVAIANMRVYEKSNETIADSLIPAPDQQSPSNIMNFLYDDVLRLIFEHPCVNLKKLIVLKNVCTRFQRIAEDIIKTKFKGTMIVDRDIENGVSMCLAEGVLREFGSLISKIELNDVCPPIGLRLITEHWKSEGEITCRMPYFPDCTHLPQSNYPKLIKLRLDNMICADLQSAESFLIQNPQLLQLQLNFIELLHLETILCHLPNLEVLTFNYVQTKRGRTTICDETIKCFGQLKCLKSLTMPYAEEIQGILKALIAENVQLERLELAGNCYSSTGVVSTICQMKSLKWLQIPQINDDDVLYLIEKLDNLTEIHIKGSNVTTNGIQDALERSNNLTKANFYVDTSNDAIHCSVINVIDEVRKSRSIDVKLV